MLGSSLRLRRVPAPVTMTVIAALTVATLAAAPGRDGVVAASTTTVETPGSARGTLELTTSATPRVVAAVTDGIGQQPTVLLVHPEGSGMVPGHSFWVAVDRYGNAVLFPYGPLDGHLTAPQLAPGTYHLTSLGGTATITMVFDGPGVPDGASIVRLAGADVGTAVAAQDWRSVQTNAFIAEAYWGGSGIRSTAGVFIQLAFHRDLADEPREVRLCSPVTGIDDWTVYASCYATGQRAEPRPADVTQRPEDDIDTYGQLEVGEAGYRSLGLASESLRWAGWIYDHTVFGFHALE